MKTFALTYTYDKVFTRAILYVARHIVQPVPKRVGSAVEPFSNRRRVGASAGLVDEPWSAGGGAGTRGPFRPTAINN